MSKTQVVVAYDFSKHADVALQRAIELACTDPNNVLHFVTVIDAGRSRRTASRATFSVARWRSPVTRWSLGLLATKPRRARCL